MRHNRKRRYRYQREGRIPRWKRKLFNRINKRDARLHLKPLIISISCDTSKLIEQLKQIQYQITMKFRLPSWVFIKHGTFP